MDASLRTLELMAGEVGATVIVLKEIVLTTPTTPSGLMDWNNPTMLRDDSPAGWVVPRLAPASIDSALDHVVVKKEKKKKKTWGRSGKRRERKAQWAHGLSEAELAASRPRDIEKQIVFDMSQITDSDSDEDDLRKLGGSDRSDDDVPPFQLDFDDTSSSSERNRVEIKDESVPVSPRVNRRRKGRPTQAVTEEEREERARKTSAKARKAMARREARRLDLLRGDGTSPPESLIAGWGMGMAPGVSESALIPPTTTSHYAPKRPSSLRLATPAPAHSPVHASEHDPETPSDDNPDDADIDLQDLLTLPLDSLSLSFADVQTVVTADPPSSASSSTEYATAWTSSRDETDSGVAYFTGEEKICVEALVVRKPVHEEEEWGWGGDDDGWGLSAEAYDYAQGGSIEELGDEPALCMGGENRVERVGRGSRSAGDEEDSWGFD